VVESGMDTLSACMAETSCAVFVLSCSDDDYDVFGLWRKSTTVGRSN